MSDLRWAATAGKGENVETYWGVEDIHAAFAQLLSAGANAHDQPKNVGGDIWVATVKDPWGNMIGIIKTRILRLNELLVCL